MRVGLITHVVGDANSKDVLQETVELARAADNAGYASFWVAQHHFGSHHGHAPSPLVLLAAIAQHTRRIELGTAVITAALENPIRLAEDAATVDVLSAGRLQLGLGAGADPYASRVFGVKHSLRHSVLRERLGSLCRELEDGRIRPQASGVRQRLWLATGSSEGYELAREFDMGILAGRKASPNAAEDRTTAERLKRFRRKQTASGHDPRTGLSRTMFCAGDRAEAHALLRPGVERWIEERVKTGRFAPGYSFDDYLRDGHIAFGTAEQINEQLNQDPCIEHASDLLLNIPQSHPKFTDNLNSIRLFARTHIHD